MIRANRDELPRASAVEQDASSGRWYVLDASGARLHGPYLDRPRIPGSAKTTLSLDDARAIGRVLADAADDIGGDWTLRQLVLSVSHRLRSTQGAVVIETNVVEP